MEDFKLLIELHKNQNRQGPGSKDSTMKAFELTGFSNKEKLNVLDIGCGTGAQTLDLAKNTMATITAVDYFDDFLNILALKANKLELSDRIITHKASMDQLDLPKHNYDLIWSEGAVYIMGFSKAIAYFKEFLVPNGVMAISEITWLTEERPQEIEEFWETNYSEMSTASDKIKQLNDNGFELLGYFELPQNDWIKNYYQPLQEYFPEFIEKNGIDAQELVKQEENEIEIYHKFKKFFSYGFYICRLL